MPKQPSSTLHGPEEPKAATRRVWLIRLRRYADIGETCALICLTLAALLALTALAVGVSGHERWTYLPLMSTVMVLALVSGFTLLLVVRVRSLGLGWLGIALGVCCLNSPLLVALLGSQLHFATKTPLLMHLYHLMPGPGLYLLVLSVIQLVIANINFMIHGRQLVAEQFEQRGGTKYARSLQCSFIPKCWEMNSCPDAARDRCPNFQDQLPCWQRRLGCLCDHQLAAYLFAAQRPATATDPHHLDLTQVQDAESFPARLRAAKPRSWRQRRPFCHNCALFLEHQSFKYRRLNWIFLPITVLLVAILFHFYDAMYGQGAQYLDQLSARLTHAGYLPTGMYGDASGLLNSPYEYVLLAVLTLLLMSYVVELTDRALLEWKW